MAIKPFHHYTRKAEDILTEHLSKDNISIYEVVAVTKTRFELVRYMASHEMAEEKYQEAFGGLMKTLDHPDFADRWVAKRVRTWVRMADVAHICERNNSLKHLLENQK